jgi:hypothetical protein
MDDRYNTGDDATVEMKKALQKTTPQTEYPTMSEAERRLKYQGKNNKS